MVPKSVTLLAFLLPLSLGIFITDTQLNHATAQPSNNPQNGTLEQVAPGYYVYLSDPRISGVIVTSDGVVVVDALSNEAMAMHERQLISDIIGQPVRYLISSSPHGNYSRGNIAYQDAIRIGQEDYRADLLGGNDVPTPQQEALLPDLTYRESMTVHVGDKEIQVTMLGPRTRGATASFSFLRTGLSLQARCFSTNAFRSWSQVLSTGLTRSILS